MLRADPNRITAHALQSLPGLARSKRTYVRKMKQIDRAAKIVLAKFTQAEVALWMVGRLEMFSEHIRTTPRGGSHADAG